MITIPYNTTDFAFTLNDVFIDISTATANTYFTLSMTVKYYDFYGVTEKTRVFPYKIPLFNQAASFNIGRIVHRTMTNIQDINNLVPQYKTAVVDLVFQELNIADDTLVAETVLAGIKFIAGILPLKLENNKAFLSANKEASRVTPKGFINVSILLPSGAQVIELFKNGVLDSSHTITATATNNVFTERLDMVTLNALPGDVFKYSIKNTNLFKEILVFPEVNASHQLLFLDEFKLLTSLECTGEFNFATKFDTITHSYRRKLVDVLETIEVINTDTLKIDTGWILKTDNITVASLMASKKAWLFISATEVIELIPLSKKMIKLDSSEFLYSYSLEFQINRSYNAQSYTL